MQLKFEVADTFKTENLGFVVEEKEVGEVAVVAGVEQVARPAQQGAYLAGFVHAGCRPRLGTRQETQNPAWGPCFRCSLSGKHQVHSLAGMALFVSLHAHGVVGFECQLPVVR